MKIVKVTKTEIYCYHNYSFMLFNRADIVGDAAIIGHCWAAGKANAGSGNSPLKVPVEAIKKGTVYHQILVMVLMELVADGDEPI